MLKRAAQLVFSFLLVLICLFGSAGRLNWIAGWVLVALYLAAGISASLVLRKDPDLVRERSRGFKDSPRWDKLVGGTVVLYGPVATWITAGLDRRFHWSTPPPIALRAAAVALTIAGFALVTWAMHSNRFFSAAVRIQKDRGQRVIHGGPYARVRHPGYAGLIVCTLAGPLILGSEWAFLPAGITVLAIVVRTALEDRLLRLQLEGYKEYATGVRSRLVPGVW